MNRKVTHKTCLRAAILIIAMMTELVAATSLSFATPVAETSQDMAARPTTPPGAKSGKPGHNKPFQHIQLKSRQGVEGRRI